MSEKSMTLLKKMNPFLSDDDVRGVMQGVAAAMNKVVRTGLLTRCIVGAERLLSSLRSLRRGGEGGVVSVTSLGLEQSYLANMLASKREYVRCKKKEGEKGVEFEYDGRFLVFEFSENIILRRSQVSFVSMCMSVDLI